MPGMSVSAGPPGSRPLMSWFGVNWARPLPWATVPCRACGERELVAYVGCGAAFTDFVCMACGDIQKVEADRS